MLSKLLVISCPILFLFFYLSSQLNSIKNDEEEFAEFEDDTHVIHEEPLNLKDQISTLKPYIDESDSGVEVENEEDNFEILEEEKDSEKILPKRPSNPILKINQVPLHFKSNWDSYYIEIILLAGLAMYFVNFITGKSRNSKMAYEWFDVHKDIFESNFLLVGDESKPQLIAGSSNEIKREDDQIFNEGELTNLETKIATDDSIDDCQTYPSDIENNKILSKDSGNIFLIWCSGRAGCEGMLVEMKLLKRQDLFSLVTSYFKHDTDKIIISAYMNNDDMDSYIMAVGQKKYINSLAKEMKDLSLYCPEKKGGEKLGLPSNFQFLSEIGEATLSLMDSKVLATFNKYADNINYVHFSDQYAGKKAPDEVNQTVKPTDTKKCLRFCFSIPSSEWNTKEKLISLRPLLLFVLYCIDKVYRFRLSKEAKQRSLKNRAKVEDTFFRQQHSNRQEAAQLRREEKRKAEKEKVLNEGDPHKQKKLEDKEYKRELKKRNPKFKQLKIRAM